METSLIISIITAFTSIFGALVSFYFATRKEKEADWRKVKFEHYREFMAALSSITEQDQTQEGHRKFALASNTIQLVASKATIKALHDFRSENAITNPNRSLDKIGILTSNLIRHLREDLGMPADDNPQDLEFRFWTSGVHLGAGGKIAGRGSDAGILQ